MFQFDAVSAALAALVLVGLFLLSVALGSSISKIPLYALTGAVVVFGLLVWCAIYFLSAPFSYISFVGYLLFLYGLLQPLGLVIYGNVILTAATSIAIFLEIGFILGYSGGRVRKTSLETQ
jgi:hypothetical protein